MSLGQEVQTSRENLVAVQNSGRDVLAIAQAAIGQLDELVATLNGPATESAGRMQLMATAAIDAAATAAGSAVAINAKLAWDCGSLTTQAEKATAAAGQVSEKVTSLVALIRLVQAGCDDLAYWIGATEVACEEGVATAAAITGS